VVSSVSNDAVEAKIQFGFCSVYQTHRVSTPLRYRCVVSYKIKQIAIIFFLKKPKQYNQAILEQINRVGRALYLQQFWLSQCHCLRGQPATHRVRPPGLQNTAVENKFLSGRKFRWSFHGYSTAKNLATFVWLGSPQLFSSHRTRE
jgi:hypothetical protein